MFNLGHLMVSSYTSGLYQRGNMGRSIILSLMDKKTFKQFNSWLANNYPELHQQLSDTDCLHDSYLTIAKLSTILPEQFLSSIKKAYYMHRRKLTAYIFRFVVPDPRFWLFYEEQECQQDYIDDEERDVIEEIEEEQHRKKINAFMQWLRRHTNDEEFAIFRLFYNENQDISIIAKLTGKTKQQVLKVIEQKCNQYREEKYKTPKAENRLVHYGSSAQCSINFSISKQEHHRIIFSKTCIERLQLKPNEKITITITDNNVFVIPHTTEGLTLHSGTRPYELRTQSKEVVKQMLNIVSATTSATIPVVPINKQQNLYKLELTKPILIK